MIYSIDEINKLSSKEKGKFVKLLSDNFGVYRLSEDIIQKIISTDDLSNNDIFDDLEIAKIYRGVNNQNYFYSGGITHKDVVNYRNAIRNEEALKVVSRSTYNGGIVPGNSNILTVSKNEHGKYDTVGALKILEEFTDKIPIESGTVYKLFQGVFRVGEYNEIYNLLEYLVSGRVKDMSEGLTEENYQKTFSFWTPLISLILINTNLNLDEKRTIIQKFLVHNDLKRNFVISLGYVLGKEFGSQSKVLIGRENIESLISYDMRAVEHGIEIFIEENNRIRVKEGVRNQFVVNFLLGKLSEGYSDIGMIALNRTFFKPTNDGNKILLGATSPYMSEEKQKEIEKRGTITTNEVIELSGFKHIVEKYELDMLDLIIPATNSNQYWPAKNARDLIMLVAVSKPSEERIKLYKELKDNRWVVTKSWLFETSFGAYDHEILYHQPRFGSSGMGKNHRVADKVNTTEFEKTIHEYIKEGMTPQNTNVATFNHNDENIIYNYVPDFRSLGLVTLVGFIKGFKKEGFSEEEIIEFVNRNLNEYYPGRFSNDSSNNQVSISELETELSELIDTLEEFFPDNLDKILVLERFSIFSLVMPEVADHYVSLKNSSLNSIREWESYWNKAANPYYRIKKHLEVELEKGVSAEKLINSMLNYIQGLSYNNFHNLMGRWTFIKDRWMLDISSDESITIYDKLLTTNIENVKKVVDSKYHGKLDDLLDEYNTLKASVELLVKNLN